MALRIRSDGRILCAAKHPAEPGDTYLDDGLHYRLSVELGVVISEPMDADPDNPGRGGHAAHGEWWWINAIPADVVLDDWHGGRTNAMLEIINRDEKTGD